MYVKFQTKHIKLQRLVSSRKTYNLHQADNQLKILDKTLSEEKKNYSLILMLYEKEECFFRSTFETGNDQSSNLLLLLQYLLATEFPKVSEEEKKALFYRVSEAYQNENTQEADRSQDTSVTAKKKKQVVDRTIKKIFQKWSKKFSSMHYFEQRPTKKLVGFFFWKKISKEKMIRIIGSLCLIGLLFFLFIHLPIAETKENTSYESLVKKEDYEKALTKYPTKEQELITMLYQKEDEKRLKQIATKYDSPLASFYTNFLNQKWKQVIKIEGITQNTTVQAMRGYAYLKLNHLEEAELINQEVHSQALTEQIDKYKKEQAYDVLRKQKIRQAETINSEIEDAQLTEDIQVAKSMMNLIDKYEQDAKNTKLSDQERKEASENLELWQRNMEQIGGKQKNNETSKESAHQ
ncbi:hypothetical protein LQF61_10980 [Tetragenococcus koreensis]|uniref:hypothetical protein n=1 Tax=Tetragenococcus TaxID=51668 RepID=UPI001F21A93F|nr:MULTISPECIES: hypothetical protein [Tetragenococcus]MDN6277995.1 hypothetical protein [Lactococcus lactis]MCF1585726.1 hypothetical protein [Tetragenococcus koreensis]MCF1615359.1 hypothetical protein [Tetragenococcus koreensis]MCF1618098.1 hypothetical protein [Tetragenococcus koreensis]MCF1620580.1 hypothetical protein [Tetragenococcus koreensis]